MWGLGLKNLKLKEDNFLFFFLNVLYRNFQIFSYIY